MRAATGRDAPSTSHLHRLLTEAGWSPLIDVRSGKRKRVKWQGEALRLWLRAGDERTGDQWRAALDATLGEAFDDA